MQILARYLRSSLILIIFLFFIVGVVTAEIVSTDLPDREGVKLGVGDIVGHGAFKVTEELETNIFLANTKEKFDSITLLNPALGIEIPLGKNKVSFDYDVGVFLYGTYNTENHIDQRAQALAEINLTDYKITVKDVLRNYTDRAADENSRRITRFTNNLRAGVGAQFNKLGFDVGYTNLIETYGSKDDLVYQNITFHDRDRMSNIVDGTVSYRFMPKTEMFFEGDLGFVKYYNSSLPPGSYYIEGLAGLRGRPTNKIRANIKGGLRFQDYNRSDIYNDKNFFGFVAAGGIDYYASDDDIFKFGIVKDVYESTYQNMNYYDACLVKLEYIHKFTKKLYLSPFGYYQISLYPGQSVEGGLYDKRYDNIYDAGILLHYDIRKWASLEFKYEYTQRTSRFAVYDYVDNRILFSGTGGF